MKYNYPIAHLIKFDKNRLARVMQNKLHNLLFSLLFVFGGFLGFGQSELDSLGEMSFDELLELYNNDTNYKPRENLLAIWITKAKSEKNAEELMTGYEIATILYKDERILAYSDSILAISTKSENFNGFSASAHERKGRYFYKKRDFKKGLDHYLLAKEYLDKSKYPILRYYNNFDIGLIKSKIGRHDEALRIYLKNLSFAKEFIKNNDNQAYLIDIYAIANTYIYLNELDSANYYNKFGFKEATSLKNTTTINFFTLNQGVTHYYKKQYKGATDSLKKALVYFEKVKDYPNSAETYYYLGSTFLKTNNIESAINYFKKIDALFQKTNDVSPIVRNTYNHLINYSKSNGDLENQLYYLNQLIKIDSIIYTNEIYLSKNLIKDYDIPQLVSERELIIRSLKNREKTSEIILYIMILLLSLLIILFIYQYNKRKKYKIRFEKIVQEKEKVQEKPNMNFDNIPVEVISSVLISLEEFETTKTFLDPNINLQVLSKKIKTNTNYLSKIINSYKETSFTNYIYNLRINYAIDQMQKNPLFKKYTIKAIACEVGFNNAETFSKAFYKSKGIKPSYFMKELEKLEG